MLCASLLSMLFAAIGQIILIVLIGLIPSAIVVAALWPKIKSVRKGFVEVRQRHKRRITNIKRWLDDAVTPANTDKLKQLRPARVAIQEKLFVIDLNARTAHVQIGVGLLGLFAVGLMVIAYIVSDLLMGRGKGWQGSSFLIGVMFLVPASQFFLGLYFGVVSPGQMSDAETTLRIINVQLLDAGLKLPSEEELDGESGVAPMDNAPVVATKTT